MITIILIYNNNNFETVITLSKNHIHCHYFIATNMLHSKKLLALMNINTDDKKKGQKKIYSYI